MVNEPSSGFPTSVSASGGAPTGGPPPLPPGYVWAYQQAIIPPEPAGRTSRWLLVVAVIWAAALLVSGIAYSFHGRSTVRSQSTIVSAQPVVDRAIGQIAAAAGSGPVIAITGFDRLGGCSITPVRSGVQYQRAVTLYVPPGTESGVLKSIATGLPTSYGASAGPGAILDLFADAGDYVAVTGTVPEPGQILVKAATGCRDAGGAIRGTGAPDLSATEMAPIRSVLGTLGITPSSTAAAQVACGTAGGTLRTVSARVPATQEPGPLDVALKSVAVDPTVHSADVVAYRTGGVDVAVTQDSTGLTVTATTPCR